MCWTFSAVAAMESSYLKSGSNMINYPRGLNLYSDDGTIQDGTIKLELAPGEERPVSFTATLFSDSEYFNPGSDQIYWEISGDMDSVSAGEVLSKSAAAARVLTAKSAGTVRVTARAGEGFATCTVTVLRSRDKDKGSNTLSRKMAGRPRADIMADTVSGSWTEQAGG